MTDEHIVGAGTPPGRSGPVEKALQELAHMAATEACVSGLCDLCLAQPRCLCDAAGAPWRDPPSAGRSGK